MEAGGGHYFPVPAAGAPAAPVAAPLFQNRRTRNRLSPEDWRSWPWHHGTRVDLLLDG